MTNRTERETPLTDALLRSTIGRMIFSHRALERHCEALAEALQMEVEYIEGMGDNYCAESRIRLARYTKLMEGVKG